MGDAKLTDGDREFLVWLASRERGTATVDEIERRHGPAGRTRTKRMVMARMIEKWAPGTYRIVSAGRRTLQGDHHDR